MKNIVSVRLEKPVLKSLTLIEKDLQIDRSEAIRRLLVKAIQKWKLEHALQRLAEHKISIGKASEEAEISLWKMFDLVKQKNINWTGYSAEDLEKDLKILAK